MARTAQESQASERSASPIQMLLAVAAAYARRDFSLRYDLHDTPQHGTELTGAELEQLALAVSRLGHELEVTQAQLDQQNTMLIQSAKMTALGEMAGGIAHELNQPLNGIALIVHEMLRDIAGGRFDIESIRRDGAELLDLVVRMAGIIDHMKRFARSPDRHTLELIDVNLAVQAALVLFSEQMKVHDIALEQRLSPDLPPVLGDPVGLEQVLVNLLSNAHDAILLRMAASGRPRGRVVLSTASDGPQHLTIRMEDDGTGVPAAIKDRIFDAFFTTKAQTEGTGLGLATAYRIVTDLGGTIRAFDATPSGAIFEIVLPTVDNSGVAGTVGDKANS